MIKIFRDLFINACILMTYLVLSTHIFTGTSLTNNPTKFKLMKGLLTGLLGVVLMIFSVKINNTIILDFRNIAIILSSFYGGLFSAVITGLIIGLFRVILFGISVSSISGFFIAIVMGIGCGLISQINIARWKKWTLLTVYTLFVASTAFSLIIKNITVIKLIISFGLGTILVVFVLYFYTRFLEKTLAANKQFKEEAQKDFLTGLNNVRQFDNLINKAFESAKDNNRSISLLYLDIDFFKKVNDTYGHIEGDNILKQLGIILNNPINNETLVFRKGGEEFAILLFGYSDKEIEEIAEQIRLEVETNNFILSSGKIIKITVSVGIASYPSNATDLDMLIENADIALYEAKHSGRNKVVSIFEIKTNS